MSEEERNVAILKELYAQWDGSKGGRADMILNILDDNVHWSSLADGSPGLEFTRACCTKEEVIGYLTELADGWDMIHYTVSDYIAQGDRVVVVATCGWRSKKTGSVLETPKCDIWRLRNGKATSFYEFYDTAKAAAVVLD